MLAYQILMGSSMPKSIRKLYSLRDFFYTKMDCQEKNTAWRASKLFGRSNTRVCGFLYLLSTRGSLAYVMPMSWSDAHLLLISERIIMRLCGAAAPTQMNGRMNEYVCRVICQLGKWENASSILQPVCAEATSWTNKRRQCSRLCVLISINRAAMVHACGKFNGNVAWNFCAGQLVTWRYFIYILSSSVCLFLMRNRCVALDDGRCVSVWHNRLPLSQIRFPI